MDFTGEQFRGIDEDAVDATRPADTAFTHYMVNNLLFLEQQFDSIGLDKHMFNPTAASGLVRTGKMQANVNEMFIKAIPIQFDRIPERVRVNIYFPFYSLGGFELWLRVDTDDFSGRDNILVDQSEIEAPATFELSVEFPSLTRPQSGTITIGFVSKDVTQLTPLSGPIVASNQLGGTIIDIFVPRDEYEDEGNFTFAEWVGSQCTTQEGGGSLAVDHVVSLAASRMVVTGLEANRVVSGLGAINIANLTRAQIASYTIDVDYQGGYFDPFELRANIVEFSDINRRIAAIQNRQFERPILLSAGPIGRTRGDWLTQYRSEWRYADGDEGEQEIYRECHSAVESLQTIDFFGLFCPVHLVNPAYQHGPALPDLYEQRATANWDVTISIIQLNPAGNITIGERTFAKSVEHLPCADLVAAPILQQAYYQKFFDLGNIDYALTYNEGNLQPVDFQYLQEYILSVPVDPLVEYDEDLPIDVVITMEFNDDVDPLFRYTPPRGFTPTKDPFGTYQNPEFLRVILVDYSVYARRGNNG